MIRQNSLRRQPPLAGLCRKMYAAPAKVVVDKRGYIYYLEGTGAGMIVMDQTTCMVDAAIHLRDRPDLIEAAGKSHQPKAANSPVCGLQAGHSTPSGRCPEVDLPAVIPAVLLSESGLLPKQYPVLPRCSHCIPGTQPTFRSQADILYSTYGCFTGTDNQK